jgi:hypothetical protein
MTHQPAELARDRGDEFLAAAQSMRSIKGLSMSAVGSAMVALVALAACDPCLDARLCLRGQFIGVDGESTAHRVVEAMVRVESTAPIWSGGVVGPVWSDGKGRFEVVLPRWEWWGWEEASSLELRVGLGGFGGTAEVHVDVPVPFDPGEVLELPAVEVWPLDLRASEEADGVRLHWSSAGRGDNAQVHLSWGFGLDVEPGSEEVLVADWLLEDASVGASVLVWWPGDGVVRASWVRDSVQVAAVDPVVPLSRGVPCLLREAFGEPARQVVRDPCWATDGIFAATAPVADECRWAGASDCRPELTLDLGEVVDVRRLVIRGAFGGGTTVVRGSLDGAQWVELLRAEDLGVFVPEEFVHEVGEPVAARYVRVEAEEAETWRIGEISVF